MYCLHWQAYNNQSEQLPSSDWLYVCVIPHGVSFGLCLLPPIILETAWQFQTALIHHRLLMGKSGELILSQIDSVSVTLCSSVNVRLSPNAVLGLLTLSDSVKAAERKLQTGQHSQSFNFYLHSTKSRPKALCTIRRKPMKPVQVMVGNMTRLWGLDIQLIHVKDTLFDQQKCRKYIP